MGKKDLDYDGMDNQGRFIPEKEHFHLRAWKTVDWLIKGFVYIFLATGSLEDIEIMDVVARIMLLIIIVLLLTMA